MNKILKSENLRALRQLASESVELMYIDPPFNTGMVQKRRRMKAVRDDSSERVAFGGRRYRIESTGDHPRYEDDFDDYIGFLRPRVEEARRILTAQGSLFLHIDPRESHYCKVMLDEVFGRDCFQNEIIWAYDYGARPSKRWPTKHDTIFWYTKHPTHYTFNLAAADRIPYMAPKLVGKEKAARGKTPTDVWWHTIVSPTGKEKTGYPTQKPLGILERIIKVHSNPGDLVLDFFAGSGTTGVAAEKHGRRYLLIDQSPEAIATMRKRLNQRTAKSTNKTL
ncbi:DNA-methyltransferase [Granulicella cerasi]|uniref:site-specific DNA-methyltransferase (adenine-specific) n=1 Tax=Granulicella cerasi TaxID=741063 RepID=A0ABW1Z5J1_9BACT|nr:site-specific DNA-methyltransferase [Granulicella cerasi]